MLRTGGRGQRAAGARREVGVGEDDDSPLSTSVHTQQRGSLGLSECGGSVCGSVRPLGSGCRAAEGMQIAAATPAIHHDGRIRTVIQSNCSYRFQRELKAGKSSLESSKLSIFHRAHPQCRHMERETRERERERENSSFVSEGTLRFI